MTDVYYKKWGLAEFVFSDGSSWIELNENFKRYPFLHSRVLEHEFAHSESLGWFDVWIELRDFFDFRKQWGLLKFVFRHPGSLTGFFPVSRNVMGSWSVDPFLLVCYVLFFVGLGVFW